MSKKIHGSQIRHSALPVIDAYDPTLSIKKPFQWMPDCAAWGKTDLGVKDWVKKLIEI